MSYNRSMKIAIAVSRFLLGLGFVVFGLNILHPFLPMPPMPADSLPMRFGAIMGPTHWMALVGVVQVLGGLLVLLGRTTPLGLTLLAPILVNILAFHLFLEGGAGIGPGFVFTALELFLMYAYRDYFKPLLTTSAAPKG